MTLPPTARSTEFSRLAIQRTLAAYARLEERFILKSWGGGADPY